MTKKYLNFLFHHVGIFVIGIITVMGVFAVLLVVSATFAWLINDTERLIMNRVAFPATGFMIIVLAAYGTGSLIYRKLSEK